MASIYDLKPAFQRLLRPLCRSFVRVGLTANHVTVAAIVLSCATGACILGWPEARWPLLLVPGMLFLRMALNAIDGMIAREHDMQTPLGAILNELGDVLSDAAIYLPLAVVPAFRAELVVGVVLLGVISEMTGVVGVQIGASRRYDGPMGKSDRAFLFGLICLIVGLGVSPHPWMYWILVVMVVLLMGTIVRRAARALNEIAS
jgi:CDP-diacylglycerol--glycerol-3-phosphate 3-phosphatidyltransferase